MPSKYVTYADVHDEITQRLSADIEADGKYSVPWTEDMMPDLIMKNNANKDFDINETSKQLAKDLMVEAIMVRVTEGKAKGDYNNQDYTNKTEFPDFDYQTKILDKNTELNNALMSLKEQPIGAVDKTVHFFKNLFK